MSLLTTTISVTPLQADTLKLIGPEARAMITDPPGNRRAGDLFEVHAHSLLIAVIDSSEPVWIRPGIKTQRRTWLHLAQGISGLAHHMIEAGLDNLPEPATAAGRYRRESERPLPEGLGLAWGVPGPEGP